MLVNWPSLLAFRHFGVGVFKSSYLDGPRTREGYYRYQGGTHCCIARGVAYSPYCDLLWMETKKPIYDQAKEFSTGIHAAHPGKFLAVRPCNNISTIFPLHSTGMLLE